MTAVELESLQKKTLYQTMNCSKCLNKDTPATSHSGETKQEYFAPIREATPTETEYLEQEERITPLQVYTHPDMIAKSSMLNNKIWALIEHVPRDDSDFWKDDFTPFQTI